MSALPDPKAAYGNRTTAGPFGETMYVVVHEPGKLLAAFGTRHDAVGWMATLAQGPERYGMSVQKYSVVPVPLGDVPLKELTHYDAAGDL